MGREAVLDNNELYKNTCFPPGSTSTGHSVLIHRGGCRPVAGVKFIRVWVYVHVHIRRGKAYGKGGRSGTACRSVCEIADFLADVSAKRVGGEDKLSLGHYTCDCRGTVQGVNHLILLERVRKHTTAARMSKSWISSRGGCNGKGECCERLEGGNAGGTLRKSSLFLRNSMASTTYTSIAPVPHQRCNVSRLLSLIT